MADQQPPKKSGGGRVPEWNGKPPPPTKPPRGYPFRKYGSILWFKQAVTEP